MQTGELDERLRVAFRRAGGLARLIRAPDGAAKIRRIAALESVAAIEALRAEIADLRALLREAREALSGMTHETESLVPVSDLNHDAAAGILDRAARARETLMRLDTIIAKQGEGK